MRMSRPSSSRCVANECRSVCGVARFAMPAKLVCLAVAIEPRGREDPVPCPLPHSFTSRVRILPREGRREFGPPGSRLNVTTMLHAHRLELPREIVLDH